MPPVLRVRLKVTGERLAQVVSMSDPVIDEMVDDTGAVLVDPKNMVTPDGENLHPTRATKRILERGFLGLASEAKLPSRAARKISKMSGWVDVVYATETESVMIDNPAQYAGGYIEHPRLAEIGMKIRVIKPGNEIDPRRDGRGIGLLYEGGRAQARKVDFLDAWMRPMVAREREVTNADGLTYNFYSIDVGSVDADTLLVLKVYPDIEKQRIRFKFEDVELP